MLTSGGIGPTHDDVTFEGVAKAFNEKLTPHPELVELCKKFFGTDDLQSPKLKLAFIPESGTLHYGIDKVTQRKALFPLVVVKNVYIFPGVPKLMETAFDHLEDLFLNPSGQYCNKEVYICSDEVAITGVLNEANDIFKDRVMIGSYPDFYNSYYKVKLTLESPKMENINELVDFLEKNLPKCSLVNYEKDPVGRAAEKVYGLVNIVDDKVFSDKLRKSLDVIEDSLSRYDMDKICIGFNGGKDCTALLHLVHAVIKHRYSTQVPNLKALYIRRGKPFPEVELFIKKCCNLYRLDIITVTGRIKDALVELKSSHPNIEAVLMGTRHSDPHSSQLNFFSPTDPGWPELMRINPILDWTYTDLWKFIRSSSLPYCSLYDRGYTSLGSMENTHPNPALQEIDEKGIISYKPAYELLDQLSERNGRN